MSKMNLTDIKDPSFLKTLSVKEMEVLANDIRQFLIDSVSKTGGHLSSNLGIVETTIAAHYVFNSPKDKIFFDVGHQAYVHKILTGRANQFDTLRQYQGLSGFQKRNESIHDAWEAGHSSTALSAAVGMAFARDLNHEDFHVIPVIGDGAIVGGESLEALNHLGASKTKVIIVLNDNQMSISQNVGGFGEFLSDIRTSHAYNATKSKYRQMMSHTSFTKQIYDISSQLKNKLKMRLIDSNIFGQFGVDYLGPIDGHDIEELIKAFNKAKEMPKSVVVHIFTQKGKGYSYAQEDKTGKWHGVEPFDVQTGQPLKKKEGQTWSEVIATSIYNQMAQNEDIVTITPAMISGSKLDSIFKTYPDRSFDVGIAEEHATTFAAGLSVAGKKPFLAIYSSFLQRAYDQINHDLARMNLNCLIGIDRAGLVGADGETHHGVFDLGILKPIPNTVIFQPSSKQEADWFINYAFKQTNGVHFIRYSRHIGLDSSIDLSKLDLGKWIKMNENKDAKAILITYGDNVNIMQDLIAKHHLAVELINACFLKPMDEALLNEIASRNLPIFVYETDLKNCGLAKDITYYYNEHHLQVSIHSYGIEDHYVCQGSVDQLLAQEGLSPMNIIEEIERIIDEKGKN